MPAFLVRSRLSSGDLRLTLTNWNGYPQDAFSVTYSIFGPDGSPASGRGLPATRASVGEYYAPWSAEAPNGSYRIDWDVRDEAGSPPSVRTEYFFVVDPSSYCPSGPVTRSAVPKPDEFTFLSGQSLGPGDLPLYLRNSSGFLQNAYAVFWCITDCDGRCVAPRAEAIRTSTGTYYAPWRTDVGSGDYRVVWEFQKDAGGPMESVRMGFSVICPARPYVMDPCSGTRYACVKLALDSPVYSVYPMTPCPAPYPVPVPVPSPELSQVITRQVLLSENGGGSDSVVILHNFGAAAVVYVLKRVALTWLDAVGTVDVSQDSAFTSVTVTNTTGVPIEFLITLVR